MYRIRGIDGTTRTIPLVGFQKLLRLLQCSDPEEFRHNYAAAIRESIVKDQLKRDSKWTEAVAVGSSEFVVQIQAMTPHRRRWETCSATDGAWVLREASEAYKAFYPGQNSGQASLGTLKMKQSITSQ